MADEADDQTPEPVEVASSPPADVAPSTGGDLEQHLSEYDAAVSRPAATDTSLEEVLEGHAIDQAVYAERSRLQGEFDARSRTELEARTLADIRSNNELSALRDNVAAADARAEQLAQVNQYLIGQRCVDCAVEEHNRLVDQARGEHSDAGLPDEFFRAYFESAGHRDEMFKDLFRQAMTEKAVNGEISPEVRLEYDKRVKAMQRELHKLVNSRIDRDATDDRDMVADAVRRGSRGDMPAEPPVHLGGMSNNEARQHIRDNYGFDPGF